MSPDEQAIIDDEAQRIESEKATRLEELNREADDYNDLGDYDLDESDDDDTEDEDEDDEGDEW